MGKTKTQDELQDDKKNSYKKLDEQGRRMQEDIADRRAAEGTYDSDGMPSMDWRTWFTGLSMAKIEDVKRFDEEENKIIFSVDVDGMDEADGYLTVYHRDGDFTDQSELARLLADEDIAPPPENLTQRLIDDRIPVYIGAYALPSNDRRQMVWRPYIPQKFNWFGRQSHRMDRIYRYIGYEGEVRHNSVAFGKSMLLSTLIALITIIILTGFEYNSLYILVGILVAVVSVAITAHTERFLEYLKERLIEEFSGETIRPED